MKRRKYSSIAKWPYFLLMACLCASIATYALSASPLVQDLESQLQELEVAQLAAQELTLEAAQELTLEAAQELEKRIIEVSQKGIRCTVGIYSGGLSANPSRSAGCGVLISEDGYILTAAHVSGRPGRKKTVRLHDGRTFTAVVLGRDQSRDYGLFKITGQDEDEKWEWAEMGNSSELAKNEVCLMFGHPDGKQEGRPIVVRVGAYLGVNREGYLRTSCLMMPGDSGGPLFDLDGKVVGINSRISSELDANYHPPVDPAKENWEKLVAGESWYSEQRSRRGRGRSGRRSRNLSQAAPEVAKPTVLTGGKSGLSELLSVQAKDLSKAVVKLRSKVKGENSSVYGMIVEADGLILSKSSRIGDETLTCQLAGKREAVPAKVIARDSVNDLALVRVEQKKLAAVKLQRRAEAATGQFLGALGMNGEVLCSGIKGAPEREIPKQEWGLFGIEFSQTADNDLTVGVAQPGKPALKAGIKAGDVIMELDGQAIKSRDQMLALLRTTSPGQQLKAKIKRGDKELAFELTLGNSRDLNQEQQRPRHPAYETKTSRRRGGFPEAFRHDLPLRLSDCGTPVVDLKGRVVGLNIARVDRPGALALPNDVLLDSIKQLKQQTTKR